MNGTQDMQDITEEAFLQKVEAENVDAPALLGTLDRLRDSGDAAKAEAWAELLQDSLAERKLSGEALDVLERRAAWSQGGERTAADWMQEALDIVGATWEQKTLVEHSGFDKGLPSAEAVRRLKLLRRLGPGTLCYDKTWGLGEVKQVDYFYQKVHVDFDKKRGHQLSFAYAAETLEIAGDDHVLVLKRKRPDELKTMIEKDAAEVVRRALRSFGPMTAAQLQQKLVPAVMDEPEWKKFWEQARRGLKKDHMIHFPTSKNDTLYVQDRARSRAEEWWENFSAERDLSSLVDSMEDLTGRTSPEKLSPEQKDALGNRLAFVVKGVTDRQRGLLARAAMAGASLGFPPGPTCDAAFFLQPDVFVPTMRQLPAKSCRGFLQYVSAPDARRAAAVFRALLPLLDVASLGEVLAFMIETGSEPVAAEVFRVAFENRAASVEFLSWLSRDMGKVGPWSLGSMFGVLQQMLEVLDEAYSADKLKAQNQLRERFIKPEWLSATLSQLTADERQKVLLRIKDAKGWPALDRQSLLAQIIKLYPEFESLFASRSSKPVETQRGPVTSQRAYQERQMQLQKIVNVEIPKVAKDIAIARSYGDLRENFEYKAAKENQTILFHRRDELHEMLRTVRPTDFADAPAGKVGMGNGVAIEYADGRRERYFILGEWDSDQALGIISSGSRMAQALEGHAPGETVTVPSEHGETSCRIVEVMPLSDEVRAWARGS